MLSKQQKTKIKDKVVEDIKKLQTKIEELKEFTKPIEPENAIGRLSRMDAINNKSVQEAALRKNKERLQLLEKILPEIEAENYGTCRGCGDAIPIERLMIRPEVLMCVGCLNAR